MPLGFRSLSLRLARRARRAVGRNGEMRIRSALATVTPVQYDSQLSGAYHCAPWKAGSQMVRAVLFDPEIYRASGLRADHIEGNHRRIWRQGRRPERHMSSAIYGTPDQLDVLDPDWRSADKAVVAVIRQPEDLLLSWYRSNHSSHDANPDVLRRRAILQTLDTEAGLLASLDDEFERLLEIMSLWCKQSVSDPRVHIATFEDLMSGSVEPWRQLFEHLDVDPSPASLDRVLRRYKIGSGNDLSALGRKYAASGSPGQTLPESARATLQERFGHHLSELPYGA